VLNRRLEACIGSRHNNVGTRRHQKAEELDFASKLRDFSPSRGRIFVRMNREHLKKVIAFLNDDGFVHLSGITWASIRRLV
jgi:hypothetical protein